VADNYQNIFKKASRTHFYSSLFFPSKQRLQVNRLYAFVRRADDLVDAIPQQRVEFLEFKSVFRILRSDKPLGETILRKSDIDVIQSFVNLEKELDFDPLWADAFVHSMELDLTEKSYQTMEQTMEYIYGSASVIGLFMSKILDLPESSYPAAISLGQSFQYINFIRDINEDIGLGRCYFPASQLEAFGLKSLDYGEVKNKPEAFTKFVALTIDQYRTWLEEAQDGINQMPHRYAVAIRTAAGMYTWTANQISKNPFVVFEKKVKPSKWQVIRTGIWNWIGI